MKVEKEQTLLKLFIYALRKLDREHGKRLTRRQLFPFDPIDFKKHYHLQTYILNRICEQGLVKKIRKSAAEVYFELQDEDGLQTLLAEDEERAMYLWPQSDLGPSSVATQAPEPTPAPVPGPSQEASPVHQEASSGTSEEEDIPQTDRMLLEELIVLVGLSAKNLAYTRDKVLNLEKQLTHVEEVVATLLKEWKSGSG